MVDVLDTRVDVCLFFFQLSEFHNTLDTIKSLIHENGSLS